MHTNTNKSYAEAERISLSEQRKLEVFIDLTKDYYKRAQNIPSIQAIRNYTNDLINKCNTDITPIPVLPALPQMPQWER